MATKEIKLNDVGCSVSLKHDMGNLTDKVLNHISDSCAVYVPYNCEQCPLGSDREPVMIQAQLRKMYDRKQCIHYPVSIGNARMELVDEGTNNAYIIINKRDLRMSKSCYRFISAADITEKAYQSAQAIIGECNKILAHGMFGCEVSIKTDDGDKSQVIEGVVAGSHNELAERIIDRLEYLETSLDGLIGQASEDMWKTLNF